MTGISLSAVPVAAQVREAVAPSPPLREETVEGRSQRDAYERDLHEGLQLVLPSALVEVSEQAEQTVASLAPRTSETSEGAVSRPSVVASLAAALGSAAASVVASSLADWLESRAQEQAERGPGWLRLAVSPSATPELATLTEFSQRRTQYVNQALGGTPVLLTRRGVVVAAVVPLKEGAYEDAVIPQAAQRVLQEQEHLETDGAAEDLSPEVIEQLRSAGGGAIAMAIAERHGIDTQGWDALNPPRDSAHASLDET